VKVGSGHIGEHPVMTVVGKIVCFTISVTFIILIRALFLLIFLKSLASYLQGQMVLSQFQILEHCIIVA
jgi:hypothetical protein